MIGRFLTANTKVKESHSRISNFTERKGMGISAVVNGNNVFLGSAKFTGASEQGIKIIDSTRAYVTINGVAKGFFKIDNKYRNHFEDIIEELSGHYELSVLSGDNSSERDYLQSIFPLNADLRFDQTAFDKLDYIKGKQKNNEQVLMLGDGLNDSGALAQADVGIAVADDINNFTPASDAILSGSNFRNLPQILKFSKTTMRIIIASFALSFLYNIVGLSFAVSGMLTPVFAAILMPLSSITIVVFATVSVSLTAKGIGFK
jgi:Cu+-exporting ATPase